MIIWYVDDVDDNDDDDDDDDDHDDDEVVVVVVVVAVCIYVCVYLYLYLLDLSLQFAFRFSVIFIHWCAGAFECVVFFVGWPTNYPLPWMVATCHCGSRSTSSSQRGSLRGAIGKCGVYPIFFTVYNMFFFNGENNDNAGYFYWNCGCTILRLNPCNQHIAAWVCACLF